MLPQTAKWISRQSEEDLRLHAERIIDLADKLREILAGIDAEDEKFKQLIGTGNDG
jgi:ferritin